METEARDLTTMSDAELRRLDNDDTKRILARRVHGAALCRLTLAKMYGRPDMATPANPLVIPFVTDRITFGVVDRMTGTAWDSASRTGDLLMLGFDTEPDQEIEAPPGWRKLRLPPTRGYYGNSAALVPENLYTHEHRIRPQLRAVGLMTDAGVRGEPRRTLNDAREQPDCFPNGIPPWVHPSFEQPDPSWLLLSDERRTELRRALADQT